MTTAIKYATQRASKSIVAALALCGLFLFYLGFQPMMRGERTFHLATGTDVARVATPPANRTCQIRRVELTASR